uniref:Tail tape measure n=1 Tax=Siphoviridae sp. ctR5S1 TaxID=2825498 RepID=A0A8S5PZ96_9CAUD|nr:MAG TPA: tail tape measure [Siphoviridae sp. ctR5S1]
MPNISTRFTLSGEKEYKQALSEIGNGMRVLDSEMRKVQSAYAQNADSVESLAAQNDVLERKILSQTEKIEYLKAALQQSAEKYGESDKRTMQWQTSLNNAEAELNNLNNKLDENKEKIEESGKETGNLGDVVSGLTEKFGIKLPEGMQKSMNSMGSLNTASVKIAGGFVALAVAIAKAEKALISMTKESAAFADNIITLSMQTGQTTDQLQEFSYATELIDVSVDTLQGSLTKLTNNMQDTINGTGNAKASFEALGISVTDADGNMRSANDVFYETIDALGDVKNETERDAMAMDIFGRSAQDLNPLIIQGSETLKAYAQEAHNVGYVLDDEALSALGAVDDAYQRLQKSQEGAKNQLSAEFAPYLTEFYEKITKLIRDGGQALKDSGIVDSFGMLLETVGDIIAPTDQLSSDTVPKLTEALRPLAEIMAGIADTIDFIDGFATVAVGGVWTALFDTDRWIGGWEKMGKAAGFGYSYGNGNNTQTLKEKWEQTDINRATSANGYGQYYANGKWYSNYESYLRDEWEKSGTGTTFEYWKMQKGYNASGTDYWRGGRTLIGEYGPEEVVLPQGTRILTAQETRQASGGDTFYITIPANTVKEFNDIVNIARNKRRTDRMGVQE